MRRYGGKLDKDGKTTDICDFWRGGGKIRRKGQTVCDLCMILGLEEC